MDIRRVLVAVWLLDDEERRESLRAEGQAIQAAFYTNYAMNAPKELSAAARRYDARVLVPALGFTPSDASPVTEAFQDALDQLRSVGMH